jgi:hypothetical protein
MINKAHIPPNQVLDYAKERGLTDVLVVGWDEDGDLYAASSSGRVEDIEELIKAVQRGLRKAVVPA